MRTRRAHRATHARVNRHHRILLIGAGAIARAHATAAEHLLSGHHELVVTDPNPEAVREFAEQFPKSRIVANASQLLAAPASTDDIVIVASPPATHVDYAAFALRTGRHVLCEKPLVTSRDELARLTQAVRESRAELACCSSRFLGYPWTERVRVLLTQGALGTPYHATFNVRQQRHRPGIEYQPSSRWFLNRQLAGGGVLLDWGVYDLSLLSELFDAVRFEVSQAWMTRPTIATGLPPDVPFDVETHGGAAICIEARAGYRVHVSYERAAATHGKERSILELDGDLGSVEWDWLPWMNDGKLSLHLRRDDEGKPVSERIEFDSAKELDCHARPLAFLLARLAGQADPAPSRNRVLFNCAATLALYEAVERRETVVVDARDFA